VGKRYSGPEERGDPSQETALGKLKTKMEI